jgi:CDGSH-type Zn-finger protein
MPIAKREMMLAPPPPEPTLPREHRNELRIMGPNPRVAWYPAGPALARGAEWLLLPDGARVRVERPTIAICRCGKSRLEPYCDGTHRFVGDQDASEPAARLVVSPCRDDSPLDQRSSIHPDEAPSTSRRARAPKATWAA